MTVQNAADLTAADIGIALHHVDAALARDPQPHPGLRGHLTSARVQLEAAAKLADLRQESRP